MPAGNDVVVRKSATAGATFRIENGSDGSPGSPSGGPQLHEMTSAPCCAAQTKASASAWEPRLDARRTGMSRARVSGSLGASLPGIAGIILIVAAGGGFKQTLVDAGVGEVIRSWAEGAEVSVLLLGYVVAVGIRVGTGSATVATITAAGIVGPLAPTLSPDHLSLLVLAIGSGSLFFSHVNDAGFWLVKESFGLTVSETIRSWSIMETVISLVGFALVMLLSLFV